MANPLTYDQIINAFKWAGINYKEYPGSRDRCRCHNGPHSAGGATSRPFSPEGTLVHITAGNLGSRTVEKYILDIINSDPNIPFKAQFIVAPDGTVWINGVGRANHDGSMSAAALEALKNATWSLTGYDDKRGSGLTGNTYAYGIENINAGPPNAAQRDSSVRIVAAIAKAMGRSGRNTAGHGEVASDRAYADPGMDMGAFRRDVMAFVSKGATNNPPPKEDELDMDRNDLKQAVAEVLRSEGVSGAADVPVMLNNGYANFLYKAIADVLRSEGVSGAADPAHNGVSTVETTLNELKELLKVKE